MSVAAPSEEVAGTKLVFDLKDVSPIIEYAIRIDGGEAIMFKDEDAERSYVLTSLTPGHHTVVVEAKDVAGNVSVASHSFTVESFEKPVFTDVPTRTNTEVIPAIKGMTRPDAMVSIEVRRASDNALIEESAGIVSGADGVFTYIPNAPFPIGVYTITAQAMTKSGLFSEPSDPIKIIVEVPGYIAFGNSAVSFLSIIVPLIALTFLGAFGTWYLWFMFKRWKRRIRKETLEAEEELAVEFKMIIKNLNAKVEELLLSRKGKLTKAELALIEQMQADLKIAQSKIHAEIKDIEDIIK